jgi:hypothetical protein
MASSPPMARSGRPTGSLRGRCSCQTGFAPPWRFVAAAMVLCGPCVCSSYKHPPTSPSNTTGEPIHTLS